MKAQLEKLFAGLDRAAAHRAAVSRRCSASPRLAFIWPSKRTSRRLSLRIGHLGGELRDKDYPALEVMADILGGGFHSRLFQRVRTKMGYAYDISARTGAPTTIIPGMFEISGSTKSQSTVDTIQAIEEEIERIRTTEVTEEELKTAKDTALNSLVFAFDTKSKTLGRMLTYEYYGYPKDFIQQYQKALAAVTRADVLRVAQGAHRPREAHHRGGGNPRDFGKPLGTPGRPGDAIDLTIPEPKAEAGCRRSRRPGRGQAAAGAGAAGSWRRRQAGRGQGFDETIEYRTGSGRRRHEREADGPLDGARAFPAGQRLPTGRISAYYGWQTGWIATRRARARSCGAQRNRCRATCSACIPSAAERPDRGTDGERSGRRHGGDQRDRRANGAAGGGREDRACPSQMIYDVNRARPGRRPRVRGDVAGFPESGRDSGAVQDHDRPGRKASSPKSTVTRIQVNRDSKLRN